MVLDKEELSLAVSVITSTFEVRRPFDEEEIEQLSEALNEFYSKHRRDG